MKTTLRLLAATALLASCEQVIDVPEPAHTPALALRYTLSTTPPPDTAWRVVTAYQQLYVGASQRLFDQRPLVGLTAAIARLLEPDGTVVEEFVPARPYAQYYYNADSAGYYRPTRGFVGQPGATYRLQVSAPGYATVESDLTLPPAAPLITAASFAPTASDDEFNRTGRLSVVVQDDPATTDYYLAYARLLDAQGQPLPYSNVYQNYSDNTGNDTDFNGGRFQLSFPGFTGGDLYPFADGQVAGRAFSLSAELQLYAYDQSGNPPLLNAQLEVVVARITRDAYEHYLSRRRYYDSNGNPFAEPAPIYSNIRNGYGVFGGSVEARIRVPL